MEVDDQPTGTCVALVLGACRCLCADIGAANTCDPEHVFNSRLLPVLEKAEYIYVEGYFITHSFPTTLQVCQMALFNLWYVNKSSRKLLVIRIRFIGRTLWPQNPILLGYLYVVEMKALIYILSPVLLFSFIFWWLLYNVLVYNVVKVFNLIFLLLNYIFSDF